MAEPLTISLSSRLTEYEPLRDSARRYITDTPTPERIASFWKSIDQGDLAAMSEMAEEIEAKSPRIYALAAKRRQAITSLDWDVKPDQKLKDDRTALEVADFVRDALTSLDSFPETLDHLATGITSGIAVVENVWSSGEIAETIPVPGDRLNVTPWIDNEVRVMHDNDWVGVPAGPTKWIVFCPTQRSWHRTRVVLPRAASYLFLAEHFAIADWLAFCELFGMPWRIGKADDSDGDAVKKTLQNAFKKLVADGYVVLPTGAEIEFLEPSRATQPYGDLITMIHDEMSILYLGQTLTTDIGDVGSRAAANTHKLVEASLHASDIRQFSRTVTRQLVRPMVEMKYPRQDAPVPQFCFVLPPMVDAEAARLQMERMRFARELGVELDPAWLVESLEVRGEVVEETEPEPKPKADETPSNQPAQEDQETP